MANELITTQLFVGLITGLLLGFFIGFMVALKSAKNRNALEGKISAIQLVSFFIFILYILISLVFERDPSWLISVGILATGYGVKGGEILEKVLEAKK